MLPINISDILSQVKIAASFPLPGFEPHAPEAMIAPRSPRTTG